MVVTEYKDEKEIPLYLNWRGANPSGFVLNINAKSSQSKSKNVIHSAKYCPSLDASRETNRQRKVQPAHPKYCSTDLDELKKIMLDNVLPYKTCGLCMKKFKM